MAVQIPDIVHAVDEEKTAIGASKDRSSFEMTSLSRGTFSSVPIAVTQNPCQTGRESSEQTSSPKEIDSPSEKHKERLIKLHDKVLVVDNVSTAKKMVEMLTAKYKNLIHACDTEDAFAAERRKAKMHNFSIAFGKTPVGLSRDWKDSAADVAMCAMLEIDRNARLKELGWMLLLQVRDEVILEGPTEYTGIAKAIVVDCMSKPFCGTNILKVDLAVVAK